MHKCSQFSSFPDFTLSFLGCYVMLYFLIGLYCVYCHQRKSILSVYLILIFILLFITYDVVIIGPCTHVHLRNIM